MKEKRNDLLNEIIVLAKNYMYSNQIEKATFHQMLDQCDGETLNELEELIKKKNVIVQSNVADIIHFYCTSFADAVALEEENFVDDFFCEEYARAQVILKSIDEFQKMTSYEKKNYRSQLSLESRDTIGFVLEGIPQKGYKDFREFIIAIYVDKLCTNGNQARFIYESLVNASENQLRRENHEFVDVDTFNYGKHCDKFSKRPSHQKKAKGKVHARIRVSKIGFN